METNYRIKKAQDLIEAKYKFKLLEHDRINKSRIVIDFNDIIIYEPDLANLILDEPEETLTCFSIACDKFNLNNIKSPKVRVKNIYKYNNVPIGQVRAQQVGKLITIKGIIKARTPVCFKIQTAKYECPNCAKVMTVLQVDKELKQPNKCSCGRKGEWRLLSSDLINGFSMVLEENIEDSETTELSKINILVKADLADFDIEKKLQRGVQVKVTGILKTYFKNQNGKKSVELDHFLEANYITIDETTDNLIITEQDKQDIIKLASDPEFIKKAANVLFKDIYGYQEQKETIILQAFGGTTIYENGNVQKRGTIHCLLVGEPGLSKSFILTLAKKILPKHYFFIAGKRTTGAGLFCGVIKDELLGVYSIEAGAMPLAHKGICLIDEFDKLDSTYRSDIHGPMEQQVYTNTQIIKATLRTECGILAAANPKDNLFSDYTNIIKSIDLPLTLINRFDYIYPIRDKIDEKDDYNKAMKILMYSNNTCDLEDNVITPILFKKFVLFAQQFKPLISKEVADYVAMKYVLLRQKASGKDMLISPRQLEAIKRTAEAKAKTRLSNTVTVEDIDFAIEKVYFCIKQILGVDENTDIEHLDLSLLELGSKKSKKNMIDFVYSSIENYNRDNKKSIEFMNLKEKANENNISEFELEQCITTLLRNGDIMEPTPGKYMKVG